MEHIKKQFLMNQLMMYMIKMEINQMVHIKNQNQIFLELMYMIKIKIN